MELAPFKYETEETELDTRIQPTIAAAANNKEAMVEHDPIATTNSAAAAAGRCLETDTTPHYARLAEIVRNLDQQNDSIKKKATAIKVRQMKIKSKARGDTRRVKMPDRFFLELITVVDKGKAGAENSCNVVSVEPVFLAKSDTIDRLLRDCKPAALPSTCSSHGWSWELLLPLTTINEGDSLNCFRQIASSSNNNPMKQSTWETAEREGVVGSFDRVILRFFQCT
jgi:hypothetical protein